MPKKDDNRAIWVAVAIVVIIIIMKKPGLFAVRVEDTMIDCEAFRQNKIGTGYKVSTCTLITSGLVECVRNAVPTASVGEYIMFYDYAEFQFPQSLPENQAKAYECIYGPIDYGPTECPNYCYTANDNAAYRGGNYRVTLDASCPGDAPYWLYFNAQGGIAQNMGGGSGQAVLQCCYSTKQFCGSQSCSKGYCTSGSCNTEADSNCDGKVDRNELGDYINKWVQNQIDRNLLGIIIHAWTTS